MAEPTASEALEERARRIRDLACIMPVVAVFLFLPPLILVFSAPVTVSGIPLIVVYLYGTWAVLVLAAFLVARGLARDDRDAGSKESDGR